MRVTHHPHAKAELIEAARFYETRRAALGEQFLEASDLAITAIKRTPTRWPADENGVRRCLLRRFPYAVYYRVSANDLFIVAFKHHRRHPDYWQYRLE